MTSAYEYVERHNSVHDTGEYLTLNWAMLWTWLDFLKAKTERNNLLPSNLTEPQNKTQQYS